MTQPRQPKDKSTRMFWRACRFLAPYRGRVIISIVCALMTGLFTAGGVATLIPLLNVLVEDKTFRQFADEKIAQHAGESLPIQLQILDRVAEYVPTDPVHAIATMFAFVFCLAVLGSMTRFTHELLSDVTAIRAINDIRRKLYDHVLHLPLGYFTQKGTSDLTARLVSDAAGLQEGFKTVLGRAVQEPINAVIFLSLAMWIDWRLTIVVIVFAPVMAMIIRKLGTKVRRAMRAALEQNSQMVGQIDATLQGIRVVKGTVAEPHERRRYRAIIEAMQTQQKKMARYEAWSTPALELLALIATGGVLIFASYLVFRKQDLEPTELIALMMCLVGIAEPIRRISKLNTVFQKANAAAARIFEVMGVRAEGREQGAGNGEPSLLGTRHPALSTQPHIQFQKLHFTYPGASDPSLRGIDLDVARGQSIAIVGRNGSGKTTLLSLLPRFFEPDSGNILIDGIDIRRWPRRKLRRMIGIVTQETIVFPGTIADNIAYAQPGITREQIVDAAKQAYAHEFIMQKPGNYEMRLDGLGAQLSGGQKQRLAIARAILRDTPILILDEATSQVDAESEHLIQKAIQALMHQRTTFVIAHRFSTILSADKIVVMEAGQIVGQGKHEQLLESCEIYRQLYERQMA